MRRKTLSNNILQTYGIKRERLEQLYPKEILIRRAETFSLEEIIELYNVFKTKN